jgi:tetratricopeptide (TPR) repeat protein
MASEAHRQRRGRKGVVIGAAALLCLVGLGVWLAGVGFWASMGIAPPPGLVSWWAAEGNCRDEIGMNSGTLENGAAFAAGLVGDAFSFNGINSYVKIPNAASLNVGSQFAIDFWMKPDPNNSMTSLQGLVASDFYGVSIGSPWHAPWGIFAYLSTDGGASFVHTTEGNGGAAVVSPGQWHHIAASYDGSELQLYADGQPWGKPVSHTGSISPMLGRSFVAIGSEDGRTGGGNGIQGRYFNGLIDEVDIFNRALSASEIQAIFAAGQHGKRKAGSRLLRAFLRGTGTGQRAALPKPWTPAVAPGQRPEPNKVRDEANALKAKGQYQGALDRFLWYWNHALEFDPRLSPVRLSFLLADWVELAQRYPKAKSALLDIRARDAQLLLAGGGDFDLFTELSSLNSYLHEEDATLEVFTKLRQRNPGLAWQCFSLAEPLLLKHGDYALCYDYLGEPDAAFNRLRQQWDLLKGQEQRAEEHADQTADIAGSIHPQARSRTADQQFVDETRQLILILVKTEHMHEAERICDRALEVLDDPRLRSAVSDAQQEPARQ